MEEKVRKNYDLEKNSVLLIAYVKSYKRKWLVYCPPHS